MSLLQTVDTVLIRNAVVLAGIVAVVMYLLFARRWSVLGLAALVGLGAVFYGQQVAFTAYVLPALERSLSETGLETAVQVQTAFEIGFAVKVVVVAVELVVEGLFTGEGPLRTLSDGLLGLVNVGVILGILVAVPALFAVSSVVLSVLSAILALRIVQVGVDIAVALAQRPAGGEPNADPS